MSEPAKTVTIDGRTHQLRHFAPRVFAAHEVMCRQDPGNPSLGREAWGPRGYALGARRDSWTENGSIATFELTLCRDGRGGTVFVHRWATRNRDELTAAVLAIEAWEGAR